MSEEQKKKFIKMVPIMPDGEPSGVATIYRETKQEEESQEDLWDAVMHIHDDPRMDDDVKKEKLNAKFILTRKEGVTTPFDRVAATIPQHIKDEVKEQVRELDSPKLYTERELEIAYCIGLINRMLTMDELSEELKKAKEKVTLLKRAINRGDYNVEEGVTH